MASSSSMLVPHTSAVSSLASGSDMNSLAAVWAYLLPALDYIMRTPTENLDAPSLGVQYHMGVYTVVYNFATASRNEKHGRLSLAAHAYGLGLGTDDEEIEIRDWDADKADRVKSMTGWELYQKLDEYFKNLARDILANAPHDDDELLDYYLKTYQRYHAGLAQINRLFAYLNRHFISRAWEEGMGWLCLADVFKQQKKGKKTKKDREKLEARKKEELKKWGYNGGSDEQRRFAESCAEAASPLDRIISIASLAQRRWRTEVVEPLTFGGAHKADSDHSSVEIEASPPRHSPPPVIIENGIPNGATTPATSKSKKRHKNRSKNKGKGKDSDGAGINGNGVNEDVHDEEKSEDCVKQNGTKKPNGDNTKPLPPPPALPAPPPAPRLPPPPKGRLNRTVGSLIMSQNAQRREVALKLTKSLKATGVNSDNLIRKRLDKLLKG